MSTPVDAMIPTTARIRSFDIDENSPIERLWQVLSKDMSEPLREACSKVAQYVKDEYACTTVGCVAILTHKELCDAMNASGGKLGWVRTIEHLLGITLERAPSAALMPLSRTDPPSSCRRAMDTEEEPIASTNTGGWMETKIVGAKHERA